MLRNCVVFMPAAYGIGFLLACLDVHVTAPFPRWLEWPVAALGAVATAGLAVHFRRRFGRFW